MIHALAQHHHNPTRLLDWTTNPLYAAFFATIDAIDSPAIVAERLAVWAVNRDDFELTEWKWEQGGVGTGDFGCVNTGWRLLAYPRHQSAFMHAQSGLFTFFNNAGYHYVVTGRWPEMQSDCPPKRVRKLTLPQGEIQELLRLLHAEGISKVHLMPHLDNISEALKYKWNATLMTLQEILGTSDPPKS